MSTDPEPKKAGLLGPLANAYEPTSADADRVLAKITAALAAPTAIAPPPPARTFGSGKYAVIAGLAALAIVAVYATRTPAETPAPSAPSVTTVTERPAAPPAVETPAMPSVAVDSLPTAAPTMTAPALKPAPVPATDDTLAREARLLAEARRAVGSGDAARGLALLDEHARTFPNGFLASDRAAERIVVLCSLGRREEAVREGRAFLANRPASPLTRRVSNSCAGEP